MEWGDLKIFFAVADAPSLSAAARALGVNQSTVSRRLYALEQNLGVDLVSRGSRHTELTRAGQELLQRSRGIAEQFASIELNMSGMDARLSGTLRVACVDVLAARYLVPHLARFIQTYGDIETVLETATKPVDLARREADVAIRITNAPPEELIGRRMFDFAMAPYCAVDCETPVDQIGWIGWPGNHPVNDLIEKNYPKGVIQHRSDSLYVINEMVQLGLGASVLACYWADCEPGLRRLDAVPLQQTGLGLWVLTHPQTQKAARVRRFVDYIYTVLAKDRDVFEGRV